MAIKKYQFTDLAREVIRTIGTKKLAEVAKIKTINRLHQMKCDNSSSRSTLIERENILKVANELLDKQYKPEDLFLKIN